MSNAFNYIKNDIEKGKKIPVGTFVEDSAGHVFRVELQDEFLLSGTYLETGKPAAVDVSGELAWVVRRAEYTEIPYPRGLVTSTKQWTADGQVVVREGQRGRLLDRVNDNLRYRVDFDGRVLIVYPSDLNPVGPEESPRRIRATEVAKLIRKALKAAFPDTKFYVQTSSSIDINWIDGPTGDQVEALAGNFAGQGFDGMIDLRYYLSHWVSPDGTVSLAYNGGTSRSGGSVPVESYPRPHPDAELVQFGSSFVFFHRGLTREYLEAEAERIHRETGWDKPNILDTETWLTKTKIVPTAYFERDYTKLVPGGRQGVNELEQEYNRKVK
jgi:hypothetical protein